MNIYCRISIRYILIMINPNSTMAYLSINSPKK